MFLCPITRRGKKKKSTNDNEKNLNNSNNNSIGMGRITGSASIETLVRVGIEKEHGLSPDSKMVVLHDFTPCVDDELEVKRGQIVNILYRENDWVYIIGQDTRQEGFIPHSYCAPYNTHLADLAIKKKLPRNSSIPGVDNQLSDYNDMVESHQVNDMVGLQNNLKHSQASLNSEPDYLPFSKDPSGRYIVLYTFIARDENDVSVERGEFVTVLNKEDPDWYWIVRTDGQEGFVPSAFVYPAENILQNQDTPHNPINSMTSQSTTATAMKNVNNNSSNIGHLLSLNNNTQINTLNNNSGGSFMPANNLNNNNNQQCQAIQIPPEPAQQMLPNDDSRYHGTELVMLYDYKAQAPDDLSVRRGELIYADLNAQTVDGWIWAFAPKAQKKCGKYGFIPKAYTQPYRQNTSV
ncbi:CLUMA_CG021235, isoform B [Clunio marinus]|uniref:CLUMA_CG021235, isoform B n=1 Tax=Clunio marinus TaxID=568069 RepID=A0A1J1JAE9_9DIPT|nr:CLUMA_CG021235, isoform B [Clunio marinus]